MTRGDWSILAESDAESETIKLLERVSDDLERNASLFDFLHEIERLTEGKKDKSRAVPDPKNWWLRSGGGTSKSVKQVGNMLSSFKKDYFLRKDTCPHKLDWDKIFEDSENYHVFLSNWIENPKLRNFLVECLLGQAVRNAQRLSNLGKLKKPILFVIPELVNLCPDEDKGSSLYLAKALRKTLVTMRSQAKGMSCVADTQIFSGTSPIVTSAFNQVFYGRLNPEDARIIFKANSYTQSERDYFKEIEEHEGSFLWYKNEDFGVFNIFMPSHMHKEVNYNWIQMYKQYFPDRMKRYDYLVNEMKKEFNNEFKKVEREVWKRERELDELEKEKSEKSEENKKEKPEKKETIETKAKEYLYKRAFELHSNNLSDRKIAEELGIKSHKTAKKYYLNYQEKLEKEKTPKEIGDSPEPA